MIETVKLLSNGYLVNNYKSVPLDPQNSDYKLVQAWLAEGNTPEPADPVD